MSETINVLIFPAGEVNSLELHDALSGCVNVKVIGASSVDRHGPYVFDNYVSGLPNIFEANFLEEFNKLLLEEKIDVVFPTHDSVALFFAENKDKISCKVVGSDLETASICRDKRKTYEVFKEEDFCPVVYELPPDDKIFFIKPKDGQGSQGARIVKNPKEISTLDLNDFVMTEYLPGIELTVDCLTDYDGKLIFISPRSRDRTMAGISVAAHLYPLTQEISKIAQRINAKLFFRGLWWFQIKLDSNNRWKLLEISVRCAGSMAVTRASGANLPLATVYILTGKKVSVCAQNYSVSMDSSLIRRYKLGITFENVYIDLDDTIIVGGKINLKAMWFLYQCINERKKIF